MRTDFVRPMYWLMLACVSTLLAGASSPAVPERSDEYVMGAESPGIMFADGFEGEALAGCAVPNSQRDTDGDGLLDDPCIDQQVSPDPVDTATPLDPFVPADFSRAIAFLYESPTPVQHAVEPGAFQDHRVAVLRGKVEDDAGMPLEGVLIRALDHPEYGYTRTRADGMFDLVVNGGGNVVIDYQASGFIRAQRTVSTPWRDWAWADDVMLVPFDEVVNELTFVQGMPAQIARGGLVDDVDGSRQATLLIPPATAAQLRMHDGTTRPMTTLHVRATEYTVGEHGGKRMPAILPSTSAYTYAVEFSADEAVELGAKSVEFDRPLAFYLDNFLEFPVGSNIPVGHYDQRVASWLPSDNGRVVRILSVDGGIATLDVDGTGLAADVATLAAIGISSTELKQLASLYPAEKTLWRTAVQHFSPWDCNTPLAPNEDDEPPPEPRDADNSDPEAYDPIVDPPCDGIGDCIEGDANNSAPDDGEDSIEDGETECGSLIRCEESTLQESIPVVGTGARLVYTSARAPGRTYKQKVRVRLSGATVPQNLRSANLVMTMLGHRVTRSFDSLTPDQFFALDVEHFDAYKRKWAGAITWTVELTYRYPLRNTNDPADFKRAWARFPATSFRTQGFSQAREYTLMRRWSARAVRTDQRPIPGVWDARSQGLGGWTLDIHHVLDADRQRLYRGDGSEQRLQSSGVDGAGILKPLIKTADMGMLDGAAASAFAPDGTAYVVTEAPHTAAWRYVNGVPQKIFDTTCPDGVAVCATAKSASSASIAVDDRDRLYIADGLRITEWAAGATRQVFRSSDHGLACPPESLVARDDRIYFACDERIYALWRDGQVTHLAGGGEQTGDGVAPADYHFGKIGALAVDADGTLYVSDTSVYSVYRIRFDGLVKRILGAGASGLFSPDGSTGVDSPFAPIESLALRNGTLLFAENLYGRIRELRPDGRVFTVAGGGGLPALLGQPSGELARTINAEAHDIHVMADGSIAFLPLNTPPSKDASGRASLSLSSSKLQPRSSAPVVLANSLHVSETGYGAKIDGSRRLVDRSGTEEYRFDATGRHRSTHDVITGSIRHAFEYDEHGALSAIVDGDGNRTSIERSASYHVVAVVAPDGQKTRLDHDPNGSLRRVEDPVARAWRMQYLGSTGLLTRFETPRGHASEFTWSQDGRLGSDINAEGGGWNLTRTRWGSRKATETTFVSAMGRKNRFLLQRAGNNTYQRTATRAGAPVRSTAVGARSEIVTHGQIGLTERRALAPDPRFGWDAPYDRETLIFVQGAGYGVNPVTRRVTRLREAFGNTQDGGVGDFDLVETTIVNDSSQTYTRTYNAATRTWNMLSPEGRTASVQLDSQGRPERMQVPGLAPVRHYYDDRGRLVATEAGEGDALRRTDLGYDTNGWLSHATDPEARTITLQRDVIGRLQRQVLPDAREITFRHDANRNLVGLTPPGRPEHQFDYDSIDRLRRYLAPEVLADESRETLYTRNLDNQLTNVLRPDGRTIERTYRPVTGHLQSITSTERGLQPVTMDAEGKPTGAARVGFAWAGPLLREQRTDLPTNGSDAQRLLRHFYNAELRLDATELRKPGGGAAIATTSYTYDNDGLLTQIGVTGAPPQHYAYHADNGLLQTASLGDLVDTWTWTPFAEPATVITSRDSTPLLGFSYTRDRLGRVTAIVETGDGTTRTTSYTYDLAGRLHTVHRNGEPLATYTYDANSNRTGTTYAGDWATSLTACATEAPIAADVDAQDRLLRYGTCEYTYNANGDLEAKLDTATNEATTYNYDEFGNLLQVVLPNNDVIEYVIDGLNRRIGKKRNGVVEQAWLYSGQLEPVAEFDGNGTLVARYIYGEKTHVPTVMIKNGITYKILSDHLGSVRQVIDLETDEIAQTLDYDVSGNVLQDTNPGFQSFGYAGGLYDRDTQLMRFGARDYDPVIGRWTAKDAIGFAGGDTNIYAYVGGDPINHVDITGLAILVMVGGPTSGNPFGHVAVAATGAGVHSFGTGTDRGSSVTDYLLKQAAYRDTKVYIIDSPSDADARLLERIRSYPDTLPAVPGPDSDDTCASRSNRALMDAGYRDPSNPYSPFFASPFPESTQAIGQFYGGQPILIARGTTQLPAVLWSFDP